MIWKRQCKKKDFYTKPFFWEESLLFLYNGVLIYLTLKAI